MLIKLVREVKHEVTATVYVNPDQVTYVAAVPGHGNYAEVGLAGGSELRVRYPEGQTIEDLARLLGLDREPLEKR
jgi:hypothetical protein